MPVVDIEKIKAEIEALKGLSAEEYCKEQVEKIYADFEASREIEIKKYEDALEVFEKFAVIEDAPVEEPVAENCVAEDLA